MSGYFSQPRYPYGLAVHPMAGVSGMPGVSGMTAVPGMPGVAAVPGMTAMQVQGGLARAPNGMSGLYQTEKPSSLYPGASAGYPGLGQPTSLLTQSGSYGAQPGAYYGAGQPTYIPVSSPAGQQRYMVSSPYGPVTSPGLMHSAAGYPLTAGAGYALQPQSTVTAGQVPVPTSLYTQAGSQYPTYISSQLTPLQISPSQNPYAASATGHPLYPSSPYASLQMQQAQMPGGQLPSHLAGRVAQVGPTSAGAGLSLGYPAGHNPQVGSPAFYQAP